MREKQVKCQLHSPVLKKVGRSRQPSQLHQRHSSPSIWVQAAADRLCATCLLFLARVFQQPQITWMKSLVDLTVSLTLGIDKHVYLCGFRATIVRIGRERVFVHYPYMGFCPFEAMWLCLEAVCVNSSQSFRHINRLLAGNSVVDLGATE